VIVPFPEKTGMARYSSLIALWLFLVAPVLAQPLAAPEEDMLSRIGLFEAPRMGQTAKRLAEAEKRVSEEKWPEAVDAYVRLLSDAADELVSLDRRHCISVRRLCHLRLAALPPAALRLYRGRVEAQAKRLLDQAVASHDVPLLRRLVDESFCSRPTEKALDLLGDLAFEKGDMEAALRWWRMLARPASAEQNKEPKEKREKQPAAEEFIDVPSLDLVYPDTSGDIAGVRAKQILALLFQSKRDKAVEEWQAFQKLHSGARGHLAGRDGDYAEILRSLIDRAETLKPPPLEEAWPTFAGAPTRNHLLAWTEDRLVRLGQGLTPDWPVELPDAHPRRQRPANGEIPRPYRAPDYYPVIAGKLVLLADYHAIYAYELTTGRLVWQEDLFARGKPNGLNQLIATRADLGYTLTVAEDRVYAQLLGPSPRLEDTSDQVYCYLVSHPLHFGVSNGHKSWRVPSRGPLLSGPSFEGAPVVQHGRAYIAESRFAMGQVQTALVCFDAETGALRWRRDLCDTPEVKEGPWRFRQYLLTVAGPNLVYCSHSGAVVAVDALTGRRAWAVRYPSRGLRTVQGKLSPRNLVPCLAADGQLYVAPHDHDRLLCLDLETGAQLWEARLEVVQLLAVARGRLIFTAATPWRCIRAVEAATGQPVSGWLQPTENLDTNEVSIMARGLVAGDYVFWPTGQGLHVLSLEEGQPVHFAEHIRGNLAAANGCLVTAGGGFLRAYLPKK
jgi:outer membrane protein assembly factor BamB